VPRRRVVAGALIAYGALGLLVVAALAASVGPALSTMDALSRSSADVERTLATTRDAFDTFASSLVEARRSSQQAAVTARGASATAKQLGDAMAISIFGAQPLLSLATNFRKQATDIESLAIDLDALGTVLGRDERDVRAIRDQLAALHDRTVLIASSSAASAPIGPVLYLLILWLGAQAAAALAAGVLLWRGRLSL
jgi:hypothetical protein